MLNLSQRQQQLPNLLVLPRFCIENYLVVPSELWHCLPQKQRAKLPDEREAAILSIAAPITENLERWVQFGALWAIINPLWDELRLLGLTETFSTLSWLWTSRVFGHSALVGIVILSLKDSG
jgi:hypothetical protein